MSKILILTGSPRRNGNTDLMVKAFIEGLTENNSDVIRIDAARSKISGCLNCSYCISHNGECVLKDDMTEIYSLLEKVDVVVFATPLYYYGFSSQLKAVIDRFHASSSVSKIKPIKSVLLSVGADDLPAFSPLIEMYNAILNYLKWENIGILTLDGIEKKEAIKDTDGLFKAKTFGNKIGSLVSI